MNLKNNSKLQNTFGFQEQNSLWIPKLIFDNNPSGGYIENDEMSILFAQPKAEPETKFNFDLNEYQEFKGSSNPIIYENTYMMKVGCELELHYYPFDTQKCYIVVGFISSKLTPYLLANFQINNNSFTALHNQNNTEIS